MDETSGRVLVAYGSKHGSVREVAEAVADLLRLHGLAVDVRDARDVREVSRYATVVLGGALYTGRWHPAARRLLKRLRSRLDERDLAVFAMGPRTLEPADVAASRAQLDAALARAPELSPRWVAVFGGVVRPEELRFPFNRMPACDARDWAAVRAWAAEVATTCAAGTARREPSHA
ncbi:MAG TPA: flavodoxin domain-containing protein [Mycobacteriales bacterium]|jgi:menaquinone-dependent protoporphyrinogen oxidase|nr:flavodoxin domain-containing protein [Mycobacteriales bacterium]